MRKTCYLLFARQVILNYSLAYDRFLRSKEKSLLIDSWTKFLQLSEKRIDRVARMYPLNLKFRVIRIFIQFDTII